MDFKKLANQAIEAQNACNLCGLAQAFANVMKELLHHPQNCIGGDWANRHPVVLLWLDKFAHLSGYPQDCPSHAYSICFDLQEGKETVWECEISDSRSREYWAQQVRQGKIQQEV